MAPTLYISDLDGTLLDSGGTLSATTTTLINHAIARGALFSVATARTPATVSVLLRNLDLRLPLIVMTGASLWRKDTGEYSDVQYFKPQQVNEIIKAYRTPEKGGGFIYTLNRDMGKGGMLEIYHIGPMNHVEKEFMEERLSSPFKRFFVSESGESDLPESIDRAVLFFGMKEEKTAVEIRNRLEKIPHINPMFYHDWHGDEIAEVEAFPEGATKAKAIKRLKEKTGAGRVVVFGDNINDLSMMKISDWSVATANAVDEVKAAADEIIGSNDSDAVARFILEDIRQ